MSARVLQQIAQCAAQQFGHAFDHQFLRPRSLHIQLRTHPRAFLSGQAHQID